MSRHMARIHAMSLVFQFPFHPGWDEDTLNQAILQYISDYMDSTPNPDDFIFIEGETFGTFTHLPKIDGLIEEKLKDWELSRIAKVDLAILRLAIYEILFASDITTATAINEAVELAKEYGTDESPIFINGLLGAVASELSDG